MAKEDLVQVVVQEIDRVGLRYTTEITRKHIKIRFWVEQRAFLYVVAKTTSDHRAALNCRAGIRRLLREALGKSDLP